MYILRPRSWIKRLGTVSPRLGMIRNRNRNTNSDAPTTPSVPGAGRAGHTKPTPEQRKHTWAVDTMSVVTHISSPANDLSSCLRLTPQRLSRLVRHAPNAWLHPQADSPLLPCIHYSSFTRATPGGQPCPESNLPSPSSQRGEPA